MYLNTHSHTSKRLLARILLELHQSVRFCRVSHASRLVYKSVDRRLCIDTGSCTVFFDRLCSPAHHSHYSIIARRIANTQTRPRWLLVNQPKVLDILTHRCHLTAPDIPSTDAAVVPVASAGICARKARAGHGGHRWAAEELPLADVIRQGAGERRGGGLGVVGGVSGGGGRAGADRGTRAP